MLDNPRLLGTGLLMMIAGAASDMDHAWVVIALGLALVTTAVLQSIELANLVRLATAPPREVVPPQPVRHWPFGE